MRHLDLFAGIGGFSLAAHWMGWTTVAQVEWDEWCQKVLAKNFPDALRFGDIVEFNKMLENGEIIADTECRTAEVILNRGSEEIGENMEGNILLSGGWVEGSDGFRKLCNGEPSVRLGHIDIITGGFPCQPFSHAGKRKGTDDSRYLWPAMLETIRRVKPSYVVGENVAGLVSMENGKTLDRILSDLEDEGYATEQVIIPACAVGAWHRRDRIWIVAHLYGAGFKQGYKKNEGRSSEQSNGNSIQYPTAYINHQGLQGRLPGGEFNPEGWQEQEDGCFTKCGIRGQWNGQVQWATEPAVGRVANGIPNRVDRLKGLGNAIVPQVAYQIFKIIEEYDSSR